jgi:hypothetical protein
LRSAPIATPPEIAFLNNFKRLLHIVAGSRFDTDPPP